MGKDLHYLGHRKRVKEKFLENGLQGFADYEALELLLMFTIVQKDVKPLAKELIERFGSFGAVLDARPELLKEIKGIGEHSITFIRFIKDAAEKYLHEKVKDKPILSSPERLLEYCKITMAGENDEQFRVIFLNSKNEVICDEVVHQGTINQTAVYPRKVLERALHHKAVALIFAHNHPSGYPEPSEADKSITRHLITAAKSLDITVHDHMIIAKRGYFSFREAGLM